MTSLSVYHDAADGMIVVDISADTAEFQTHMALTQDEAEQLESELQEALSAAEFHDVEDARDAA